MNIFWFMLCWFVVSIPAALFMGWFLNVVSPLHDDED